MYEVKAAGKNGVSRVTVGTESGGSVHRSPPPPKGAPPL